MDLSLAGTFYSLLTGLTLAGFYMLNKKAAHAGRTLPVLLTIFILHLPVFMLWIAMAPASRIAPGYFLPGLAVVALTLGGNILTLRALALSPFSLMIPVLGLSPVFTSLIGIPLLQEWPSAAQWIGIALAVIGVLWLYAPPEKPLHVFSFLPGFLRERGAPYMAGAALMWSLSAPMDKLALRQADAQFHALFVFTGFDIALLIWLIMRGEGREPPIARRWWALLAATGSLGALSYICQLIALQHAPAGPFEAIKRVMGQLSALAFGYFLFNERITTPKLIGVGILSIGVPLIVL